MIQEKIIRTGERIGRMWWNKMIFGFGAYHVVLWFLTYSILGWMVESAYMSFCNRKLTNRGFTRGPLCPIYGVGALTVFFALYPYSANPLRLFFYGMFLATMIEFFTALVMIKVFGQFWWDYRDKPFNFKGILCLESSVAWGFYTLALFAFLQNMVTSIVNVIPVMAGKIGGTLIIFLYAVDFLATFYKQNKQKKVKKVLSELKTQIYTDTV